MRMVRATKIFSEVERFLSEKGLEASPPVSSGEAGLTHSFPSGFEPTQVMTVKNNLDKPLFTLAFSKDKFWTDLIDSESKGQLMELEMRLRKIGITQVR